MSAKAKKEKNITKMTKAAHNYDGYNVRVQKLNHMFRQYVSASESTRGKKKESTRFADAMKDAVAKRNELLELLQSKKSWIANPDAPGGFQYSLAPAAAKKAAAMGFLVAISPVAKV
jgi:hypothetical protein